MITCEGVTKCYGTTRALDDLTLQIDQPGIYCLLGRNGAGKTTLLRTLAGRTDATTGRVVVAGHEVSVVAPPPGLRFTEANASQFNLRLRDLLHYAAELSDGFDETYARPAVLVTIDAAIIAVLFTILSIPSSFRALYWGFWWIMTGPNPFVQVPIGLAVAAGLALLGWALLRRRTY